jgi:oxygen-independent coproporphyrinogen-3 oxidase
MKPDAGKPDTVPPETLAGARPIDRTVTVDLLSRYDRPGPRYTSYPTAVEFHERVTTSEHLDALAKLGFNRVSFGVQDLNPDVQEAINRVQTREQTARLVDHAREKGYRGINVDLIYGLPLQTPETFEKTVDSVIALGPDRAAVYSFAFVPWVRGAQKKIEEDQLPAPDVKVQLFAIARERFLAAGYEPIGMDHFARPDDDLAIARREGTLRRNFQGYAVIPGDDVVGLGISAIGDVRGSYFQNEKKLSTYEEVITEGRLPVYRGVRRSADDELRRTVIHELMCNFRVDARAIERQYGIDFATYFTDDLALLAPHERDGMVVVSADGLRATPVGELFVRNLAMCFDRYQREKHAEGTKPVFSRTV